MRDCYALWRATQDSVGRAVATDEGGKKKGPVFGGQRAFPTPKSRGHHSEAAAHAGEHEADHRRELMKKPTFHTCGQRLLSWLCLFPAF